MSGEPTRPGQGPMEGLVLQALIKTLVARGILSRDDVLSLLTEAALRLDVVGGVQTPEAARAMVEGDLAPVFLGEAGEDGTVKPAS